jgi:hypothetical protein
MEGMEENGSTLLLLYTRSASMGDILLRHFAMRGALAYPGAILLTFKMQ